MEINLYAYKQMYANLLLEMPNRRYSYSVVKSIKVICRQIQDRKIPDSKIYVE